MANLVFPQLASGALAQFPIRKTRVERTIKNLLPDGSLIAFADPSAARLSWELAFASLSSIDLSALTELFAACQGRLRGFTFIDPADNMLNSSANIQASAWQASSGLMLAPQVTDPTGAINAFTATNTGQVPAQLSQMLAVPAGYHYCFSVFAVSAAPTIVQLIRSGPSVQDELSVPLTTQWSRVVSSGRLADAGATFTIAIQLQAGQQVSLYGPQLEAQIAPSRYCATVAGGGVYPNAHWASDELLVSADAPGLFTTVFAVETAL